MLCQLAEDKRPMESTGLVEEANEEFSGNFAGTPSWLHFLSPSHRELGEHTTELNAEVFHCRRQAVLLIRSDAFRCSRCSLAGEPFAAFDKARYFADNTIVTGWNHRAARIGLRLPDAGRFNQTRHVVPNWRRLRDAM
jgi:hypothetical protein